MAIAAGRRLSDRLFGGAEGAKADYTNVPVSFTLGSMRYVYLVFFVWSECEFLMNTAIKNRDPFRAGRSQFYDRPTEVSANK